MGGSGSKDETNADNSSSLTSMLSTWFNNTNATANATAKEVADTADAGITDIGKKRNNPNLFNDVVQKIKGTNITGYGRSKTKKHKHKKSKRKSGNRTGKRTWIKY